MLFAFEGIDGCGKTTLAKFALDELTRRGYDVVLFQEPTDMEWGQKIRRAFESGNRLPPEEEAKYFVNDRKDDVEKRIKPALAEKKLVLLDRYYFSTAAYQGAEGLNWRAIVRQNEAFAPLPRVVFFLAISPEIALKRIDSNRRRRTAPEKFSVLFRVDREYRKMFAELRRAEKSYEIVELDATKSTIELLDLALAVVLKFAPKKRD